MYVVASVSTLLTYPPTEPASAPKNELMKDGKFFEEVIRLVQEALKNDHDTRIYKNHKVEDRDGELREFDVFVVGNMNGEPIHIAIECKDHSRKISRGPIESYVTKCRSVPNINKKIFVSRKGFTKGALLTARNNDVILYTLEDLDTSKISEWLGTTMILPALVMPVFTARSVTTSTKLIDEPKLTDVVRGGGFKKDLTLWEVAKQIGELVILATGEFSGRFILLEGYTYTCDMPFKKGVELVTGGKIYQLESMVVEVGVSVAKPIAEVQYNQYCSVDGGLTVDTASSISETGTITVVKREGADESIVHATFDLKAAQEVFRMKVERFNSGEEGALP